MESICTYYLNLIHSTLFKRDLVFQIKGIVLYLPNFKKMYANTYFKTIKKLISVAFKSEICSHWWRIWSSSTFRTRYAKKTQKSRWSSNGISRILTRKVADLLIEVISINIEHLSLLFIHVRSCPYRKLLKNRNGNGFVVFVF